MALSGEDWSEWETANADGLAACPWDDGEAQKRAGRNAGYRAIRRREAVKRLEIRWADLDPARGAEMAKKRPVVIVSLDILNEQLQAVTTRIHPSWRSRPQVRIGLRRGEIALDQIRTIGKHRLGSRAGVLSEAESAALWRIITEMYGE